MKKVCLITNLKRGEKAQSVDSVLLISCPDLGRPLGPWFSLGKRGSGPRNTKYVRSGRKNKCLPFGSLRKKSSPLLQHVIRHCGPCNPGVHTNNPSLFYPPQRDCLVRLLSWIRTLLSSTVTKESTCILVRERSSYTTVHWTGRGASRKYPVLPMGAQCWLLETNEVLTVHGWTQPHPHSVTPPGVFYLPFLIRKDIVSFEWNSFLTLT